VTAEVKPITPQPTTITSARATLLSFLMSLDTLYAHAWCPCIPCPESRLDSSSAQLRFRLPARVESIYEVRPKHESHNFTRSLAGSDASTAGSVMFRKTEETYFRMPSVRSGVKRDASKRLVDSTAEDTPRKPASAKPARHPCSSRKLTPIRASTKRFSVSSGQGFQ
jgi:hypothetical protein